MLWNKNKPEPEKQKTFGFDYEFGIRGAKNGAFTQSKLESRQNAEESREKVLMAFRTAIKEDTIAEIDADLHIRGQDLTWFWVGEVWEK